MPAWLKTLVSAVALVGMLACARAQEGGDDPASVVWTTPSADSSGSMPLGNGDIGLNCWVDNEGGVQFYISKTDAWSGIGRLLKLGKVVCTLDPSPFGPGKMFRQSLDTERGLIEVLGGTEVAPVTLRIWVDANNPRVCVDVEGIEPAKFEASVEIWRTGDRELTTGERNSAYGIMEAPFPVVEEGDTLVSGRASDVVWFHRNTRSMWADSLRRQGMGAWADANPDPLLNRTFGGLMRGEGMTPKAPGTLASSEARNAHHLSIYVLTAIAARAEDWIAQIEALAQNDTQDRAAAFDAHAQWWKDFWGRSWIRVTGPDAAIVNRGYRLQRFITACAGRGGSPIKFNGSIFTVDAESDGEHFDADFRRWGGPYWFQNTRLVYWPMLAAGDIEMMRPLFRMYTEALPFAAARTQTYFNHGGAFFPETMYFWGGYADDNYGWKREGLDVGTTENTYIRYYYDGTLELLAMMMDHVQFTQDDAFFRETVLPFADAVITFYDKHYGRSADGRLRIDPSQALETWQKAVNPAPPIVGLRRVLALLLERPDIGNMRRTDWKRFEGELPTLPLSSTSDKATLAAAAYIFEEARNSENPELYAVFPYRFFCVGKPALDIARRTFEARRIKGNTGWQQDDTQAALLGLAGEARNRLVDRLSRKHEGSRFPAFWGPNFDWIPDQDHGGNAQMALQSMLMQSEGKRILLFPAWPKSWDVEFRLHAPYGTVLEGVLRAGNLESLQVEPAARRADVTVLDPQ